MTLCRFENRVADPLAETASSRFVKQLGYLTLLHQACQTFSIVCVALGNQPRSSCQIAVQRGPLGTAFRLPSPFGPIVSPRLRSEVPHKEPALNFKRDQ